MINQKVKNTPNYTAWLTPRLNREEFWQLSKIEQYKYLAQLGHLAANSHNTQPWAFSYDTNSESLNVWIETKRVLPISDIKGRQAAVSVGCSMANIEVAAQYLGAGYERMIRISDDQVISNEQPRILAAQYKIFPQDPSQNSTETGSASLYNAIFDRRVDRGEYDHDRKIDPQINQTIEKLGADLNVKTILISDWGRKVALAELQQQADSFGVNNPKFADELINDWIIENTSESELGMPGDTFRLSDEQTAKIKLRFKNKMGFESDDATSIAQLGKKGILSCQCVGLLTVEKDVPSEWLKAGVVLERGALVCEANGISWTVHAGLAEVSQVNMLMLRPIAMTSKRPVVLFRAGYLKTTEQRSPHSPRLSLDKVWVENGSH